MRIDVLQLELTADNSGVTAQTLQTLHQFPDRQLVGEEVIWADGGDGSFLSSHRLVSVMRHQGDGSSLGGQPPGRRRTDPAARPGNQGDRVL